MIKETSLNREEAMEIDYSGQIEGADQDDGHVDGNQIEEENDVEVVEIEDDDDDDEDEEEEEEEEEEEDDDEDEEEVIATSSHYPDAKKFSELSKRLMRTIPDYPIVEQTHHIWEIKDWSGFKENKIRGPEFKCGGFIWNILMFPNGNNNNQLALYLEPHPDPSNPDIDPENWYVCAQFGLDIWNPNHSESHISSGSFHRFNKNETDWGFSNFIDLKNLYSTNYVRQMSIKVPDASQRGHAILENNQLNITAYVKVIDDSSTGVLWHSFTTLDYDSKRATGYVGLNNQGATCYLNSLLQSYFTTKCFRKLVYQIPTEGDSKGKSVPLSLQRIFYQLTNSKDPVATLELTKSFGWDSLDAFTQHDVQELNRILMDKLESAMKGTDIENSLNPIFVGKMKSYIKCVDVAYESSRVEDFWDIQLNVKGFQNLQQAFANYIEVEMLEGENKYQAGDEFGYQDAKKGVVFESFPDVLHLQLKRFEYDFMIDDLVKIDDNFEFPDSIDLSPYLDHNPAGGEGENWNYKLHGVLVHQGSISNGHYYALIKPSAQKSTAMDSGWLRFDDDKVWKVTPNQVFHENFGAHELTSEKLLKMSKAEQNEYIMRRTTSAYMLVYYRESKLDIILPESNDSIEAVIPEHIPLNINKEIEERLSLERAKQEALYYINVKVATINNFNHYDSCDLYPDITNERFYDPSLFDPELNPLTVKIKKEDSFKNLYLEIGKQLGLIDMNSDEVSTFPFRLIAMNHRNNHTNRSYFPVFDSLEKTIAEVYADNFNRKYDEMSFFVEEKSKELLTVALNLPNGEGTPEDFSFEEVLSRLDKSNKVVEDSEFLPILETSDHIIIFVKYFDCFSGELRGLTYVTALKDDPLRSLIAPINKLLGFKEDTQLLIYEELNPTKLEILSIDTTFEKNELGNGDIICFQAFDVPASKKDIKAYYKFLLTRFHVLVSAFYPNERDEDIEFVEESGDVQRGKVTNGDGESVAPVFDFWISVQSTYLEFANEIAKRINVDPTYLRIFAVNHHKVKFPLKRMASIQQIFGKTVSASQITNFEYEVLSIPLEQYENMKLIKFNWLTSLVHYQTFEFLIPRKSLVGEDLVNRLLNKVPISAKDLPNLLIWSGINHKYVDIIKFNREINSIPDTFEVYGAILPAEVETLVNYDMVKRYEPSSEEVASLVESTSEKSETDEEVLEYELQQVKTFNRKLNMIPGFHFHKNSTYHHGIPFIFPVFPGEKFYDTKARLRAKMGLGIKEFDKIKFALADGNDKGRYIDSENVEFSLYEELKKHPDQLSLALDHPDRSAKRLNQYDRGISIK